MTTQQAGLPPLPEPYDAGEFNPRAKVFRAADLLTYGQLCRQQALEDAYNILSAWIPPVAREVAYESIESLK